MRLGYIGVTPVKERQFKKKGIVDVESLLRYVPRRYNDFTKITGILPETEISCIVAHLEGIRVYNTSKIPVLKAFCKTKDGDKLIVTWFRQTFLQYEFSKYVDKDVFIAGKIKKSQMPNGGYEIASPEQFVEFKESTLRVIPVYSKIPGMSNDYLTSTIEKAIHANIEIGEPYPEEIVRKYTGLSMYDTYCCLHFPRSMDDVQKAKTRIVKDDLLYFAAINEWASRNSATGSPFNIKSMKLAYDVAASLPYKLTEDQKNAINAMVEDVKSGKRINALVQGDVGCGKTIVAIIMMCAFVGSGYQAVLMAPTQVLARQHFEDISSMLKPFGINVVYLGTDIKAKEKKQILADIENGTASIVVGTHSVIGKSVQYNNLAITVADEEHKFGVAQREALVKKASVGVHSVTMSATPIPRSMAQAMYGGYVQLHNITTMPAGRQKVETNYASSQEKLFAFITKEAKERGHQTYVVCPMIEASDSVEGVRSVEEVKETYEKALAPRGVKVATLTGKDSKEKTTQTIDDFRSGKIDVLISTTVVEVGVNVPTATLMVIVDPDRFGLASLHQLRGRVGRSSLRSFCVLDGKPTTEQGIARLDALIHHSNGFEIAQEDLKLRGAGDFIGTKQSGENKYLSLTLAYPEIYEQMKELAVQLIDRCGWIPKTEEAEDEAS